MVAVRMISASQALHTAAFNSAATTPSFLPGQVPCWHSEYANNVSLQAPSSPRPLQRRRRCTDRPRPPSAHRAHRRIHHRRVHSHRTPRREEDRPQETLSLLQKRQASKDCRLCRLRRHHHPHTNTWSTSKYIRQRPALRHGSRSLWPTARSLSQEQSTDKQ